MTTGKAGPKGSATSRKGAARTKNLPRANFDTLLDVLHVQWGSVTEEELPAAAERAEQDFKRTKNPLYALYAVKLAAEGNLAPPRSVAMWLWSGIGAYLHERRPTLDAALGLNGTGRANPRLQIKSDRALKSKLSMMLMLQMYGATIPQAALLVAVRWGGYSRYTLESHYRRSGYSAVVKDALELEILSPDPEAVLAEYPDGLLEVAQAKAAMRAVYAKRRP